MKKLIIACIGVAIASGANAYLYNTMDPILTYPEFDLMSPYATHVSGAGNPVVDDVTFNNDVTITGYACRLLSNTDYSSYGTLSGHFYLYDTLNGLPNTEIFGLAQTVNFTIVQVASNSGPFYTTYLNLDLPLSIQLNSGKYWFGVLLDQVYTPNGAELSPFYFAGNDYGMGNNTMIKDGTWQVWTSPYSGDVPMHTDLSFAITGEYGEPAVPGPAAILPFGIGLVAAMRRRRK